MTKDFWPNIDEIKEETNPNNSLKIIREQAYLLGEKTGNTLKASFTKINFTQTGIDTIKYVSEIMSQKPKEIEDSELASKKNINTLFEPIYYRFSLYNKTYKFRVFDLIYSHEYPISILVDEGIREEINLKGEEVIQSDREMEDLLRQILGSGKIIRILRIMKNKQD